MLNVLCILGTVIGLAMMVSFFILVANGFKPYLTLFISGLIIIAVSAGWYDHMAKKTKYDAEKNAAKIKQHNELHQKFLDSVKDDPDFKIYFEK